MRFFIRRLSGTGNLVITGAPADSKGNKDSAVLATALENLAPQALGDTVVQGPIITMPAATCSLVVL